MRFVRDENTIQRPFHIRRHRRYTIRFETQPAYRISGIGIIIMSLAAVYCVVRLLSYGINIYNARQASAQLQQIYYEEASATPSAAPSATPFPAPSTTPRATSIPTATPAATPETRLSIIRYPNNPDRQVSRRFQKLRRQNADIIGWLNIDGLVDEAVVQRDNTYYLNRDYRGYHNVSGAIFLEETCNLNMRPYTLMLYGHNMKSGTMFAGLRNYESLTYYRKNPFITFDTAYEDGRYVIFSVATISLNPRSPNYIDFSKLNSSIIDCRNETLAVLKRISVHYTSLDVAAQDQLLLLMTCAKNDSERRVIAARRVREGESEDALSKIVQRAEKR